MDGVSIITLVKGREVALSNIILGLNRGTETPNELVIVYMNEAAYNLPPTPFKIIAVELKDRESIPLAKARNLGAQNAAFDKLIFLDVDCIPAENLVESYRACIDDAHLWSGAIRYLSEDSLRHPKLLDFLPEVSFRDPIRAGLAKLPYELFWSLNFGCSKKVFQLIGGFDEGYTGYGAEDTDFAFRAREMKVPLQTTEITAYHQYHVSYNPPLNHLEDIVENANRFFRVWKKWPMEGWLKAFREMKLITWDDQLAVIRNPSSTEMQQAKR